MQEQQNDQQPPKTTLMDEVPHTVLSIASLRGDFGSYAPLVSVLDGAFRYDREEHPYPLEQSIADTTLNQVTKATLNFLGSPGQLFNRTADACEVFRPYTDHAANALSQQADKVEENLSSTFSTAPPETLLEWLDSNERLHEQLTELGGLRFFEKSFRLPGQIADLRKKIPEAVATFGEKIAERATETAHHIEEKRKALYPTPPTDSWLPLEPGDTHYDTIQTGEALWRLGDKVGNIPRQGLNAIPSLVKKAHQARSSLVEKAHQGLTRLGEMLQEVDETEDAMLGRSFRAKRSREETSSFETTTSSTSEMEEPSVSQSIQQSPENFSSFLQPLYVPQENNYLPYESLPFIYSEPDPQQPSVTTDWSDAGFAVTATLPLTGTTTAFLGLGLLAFGGAEAMTRNFLHPYQKVTELGKEAALDKANRLIPEASLDDRQHLSELLQQEHRVKQEVQNCDAAKKRRGGSFLAKNVGELVRGINKKIINKKQLTRKEAHRRYDEAVEKHEEVSSDIHRFFSSSSGPIRDFIESSSRPKFK